MIENLSLRPGNGSHFPPRLFLYVTSFCSPLTVFLLHSRVASNKPYPLLHHHTLHLALSCIASLLQSRRSYSSRPQPASQTIPEAENRPPLAATAGQGLSRYEPRRSCCLMGSLGLVSELPTSISQSFPPRGQVLESGSLALKLPLFSALRSPPSFPVDMAVMENKRCLSHTQLNVTAVSFLQAPPPTTSYHQTCRHPRTLKAYRREIVARAAASASISFLDLPSLGFSISLTPLPPRLPSARGFCVAI